MISLRLKSLVKYVDRNDKVIDIGCDHALLDIYLVKELNLNNVIVSDIHEKALESGIKNIRRYGLSDKIETRLGDGLEILNEQDDVDTIIISGMGTNTILHILNNEYIKKIKKMIIESNRDYDILREEVVKLGFYISKEEVIEDNGKIYIAIIFLRGERKYSYKELMYGTKEMINKDIYYDFLLNKKRTILKKLVNDNDIRLLEQEIKLLEKLKTAK